MLIVFGGLPGVGKTTIARDLARRMGAVFLRIDSIESALRESGRLAAGVEDAGYRAACAVAEDNLRGGRIVIADCVNPLRLTRDAWRAVAARAAAGILEVEVVCSDTAEHPPPRRRARYRLCRRDGHVGRRAEARVPSLGPPPPRRRHCPHQPCRQRGNSAAARGWRHAGN